MSQSLSWYMAHTKGKDNEKYCGHHSHPLKLIPTNAQTKIHANAPRNDSETEGTQLSDACTKTFWQHLARIKTNQLPQANKLAKVPAVCQPQKSFLIFSHSIRRRNSEASDEGPFSVSPMSWYL